MAAKADFLRRSVYRAALMSAVGTAVLTIALAFAVSAFLGNPARDALVAKNARDIAALVNEHRGASCEAQTSLVQLLVDIPGTPNQSRVQDCRALEEGRTEYYLYKERK